MGLLLRHYSNKIVREVHSRSQGLPHFKPNGLWLSVDSERQNWPAWCDDAGMFTASLKVVYSVRLRADANVLHISTPARLQRFTRDYVTSYPHLPERRKIRSSIDTLYLDWMKISRRWQGILITPYLWQCRLDHRTFWYYAWDCASACIWDADAISSIKRIKRKRDTLCRHKLYTPSPNSATKKKLSPPRPSAGKSSNEKRN